MVTATDQHRNEPTGDLTVSLHDAQARGLLDDPDTVEQLLLGIAGAVVHTVDGNARDTASAWALRSPTYWDHFGMYLRESVLVACAGLDPALRNQVRRVLDDTLADLQRAYRTC